MALGLKVEFSQACSMLQKGKSLLERWFCYAPYTRRGQAHGISRHHVQLRSIVNERLGIKGKDLSKIDCLRGRKEVRELPYITSTSLLAQIQISQTRSFHSRRLETPAQIRNSPDPKTGYTRGKPGTSSPTILTTSHPTGAIIVWEKCVSQNRAA